MPPQDLPWWLGRLPRSSLACAGGVLQAPGEALRVSEGCGTIWSTACVLGGPAHQDPRKSSSEEGGRSDLMRYGPAPAISWEESEAGNGAKRNPRDSRKDRTMAPAKLQDSPHTEPRLDVRERLQTQGHRVCQGKMGPTGHTRAPATAVEPPSRARAADRTLSLHPASDYVLVSMKEKCHHGGRLPRQCPGSGLFKQNPQPGN